MANPTRRENVNQPACSWWIERLYVEPTRSDVERANEARRRAREAAEALAGESAEAGR